MKCVRINYKLASVLHGERDICKFISYPIVSLYFKQNNVIIFLTLYSTEDEEPVFYGGKNSSISGDDSWTQQPSKQGGNDLSPPKPIYSVSDQDNKSVRSCGCNPKKSSAGGVCGRGLEKCIPNATHTKKQTRQLSERLLAPTLTSLAKRLQTPGKEKNKELDSNAQRPLSKRAVIFSLSTKYILIVFSKILFEGFIFVLP